ncbi:hypothetical protein [Pseudomonas putida]|uniref:hypothetical protein n=1 Tax=Pseudomonas putida TaxID=303 RepID=UPI002DBB6308|nr:hypothetical protein [Pseudomonas putida]WRW04792.1 hypothetical protein VPZ82_05055 [Pseudomonas putida]
MSAIDDYRSALNRLKINKPLILPKGSAINKDTVALEAGRKRGSIKKSRDEHTDLIAEIEAAAANSDDDTRASASQLIEKQKTLKKAAQIKLTELQKDYELALTKIASLEFENFTLRAALEEARQDSKGNNKITKLAKNRDILK